MVITGVLLGVKFHLDSANEIVTVSNNVYFKGMCGRLDISLRIEVKGIKGREVKGIEGKGRAGQGQVRERRTLSRSFQIFWLRPCC